jgi:hypothetical protein
MSAWSQLAVAVQRRHLSLDAWRTWETAGGTHQLLRGNGGRFAVVTSVLLSLLLASNAAGSSWSEVGVAVTTGFDETIDGMGWPSGLVTAAPSTAIALYQKQFIDAGIFIKRSTNGGSTWSEPVRLSTIEVDEPDYAFPPIGRAAIAAGGSAVDIVWIEDWHDRDASHVRYLRSNNSGASLSPAVTIADPLRGHPAEVSVGRNGGDLVAFAYVHKRAGVHRLLVKVSTNDGVKFGSFALLARSALVRDVKLAVADGVIYVAYMERQRDNRIRLQLSRSLDAGVSWTDPTTIGDAPIVCCGRLVAPSILASGSRAWVGYTAVVNGTWRARYRSTPNKGSTWSSAVDLTQGRSAAPVLALAGDDLHAAYMRCYSEGCGEEATIFYKHKPAGGSWSGAENTGGCCYAISLAAIGWVGKPIVLWMLEPDGSCCYTLGTFANTRSP